ncbi:hypothetical protein BH09PAT4_BH09PAT4_04900 [soil metagenome]
MTSFKKLNSNGFAHALLVPLIIVVGFAIFGTYQLVKSHADSFSGGGSKISHSKCTSLQRRWLGSGCSWSAKALPKGKADAYCKSKGMEYVKSSTYDYCKVPPVAVSTLTCNLSLSRKPAQGVSTTYSFTVNNTTPTKKLYVVLQGEKKSGSSSSTGFHVQKTITLSTNGTTKYSFSATTPKSPYHGQTFNRVTIYVYYENSSGQHFPAGCNPASWAI